MKNKRFTFVVIISALALITILIGTRSDSAAGKQAAKADPIAVEVTPVSLSSLSESVSAVGNISAITDATVSSETSGRVTRVAVKVGDAVRKGQILLQIDDELRIIAVEQAKAQLMAAGTNFEKSKKDYARAQMLYASKDISDAELESNKLAMQSAEAQLKSAQVGLKLAQRQLDDTHIKSPINGVVASRRVDLGEMVAPGREVANVIDISKVKVKLSIPEEEIGLLRLKQSATLEIDSDPGTVFKGSVYTVGSKTESANGHSYPVEIIVDNTKSGVLKAGMFARVTIRTRSVQNAMVISKESLLDEEANPRVFVVKDNVAKLRPIRIGIRSGDKVEVTGGLNKGELVISFGQKKLKDGSAVSYTGGTK